MGTCNTLSLKTKNERICKGNSRTIKGFGK